MHEWKTIPTYRLREVWKCPDCAAEVYYNDLTDRRTRPVLCPECGDMLEFSEHQMRTDNN